ncbi:hypothetical protein [Litchfieldia salsa]|uniref:Uncharacterized protein n=1 Tax=Litchfieldia salsa TaxID=930152 RepID=A0A1H0TJB3_9BACI|nr:hypothetical protein [Litchfieldia salsa]SDP54074.1 hypothetical protein SAMN05216565_103563 [Litchfieldia salsa]
MKKNKGNEEMPDFQQLSDRIIANPSPEPSIVIKTNLDPKGPTDENPYFVEGKSDEDKFSSYFSDKQ